MRPGHPEQPSAPGDQRRPPAGQTHDMDLREAFHRSVDEGKARLHRSWSNLLATGFVGGFDVSLGVLAILAIEASTHSRLLGALGFTIGFIALALGRSELFTENFLVPIATVAAGRARVRDLFRLWAGTCFANLVAGWLVAWLIVSSLPRLHVTGVEIATFYAELSNWSAVILGLLGGMVITLMTWMEQGSRSEGGRLAAVSSAAFLLAAAPLNHIIVVSIVMFAGIHAGAPFGYGEWFRVAGIAGITNLIGGVFLVTALRLLQVGPEEIRKERERAPGAPREA